MSSAAFDRAIATALAAVLAFAGGIGAAYFAGHQDGQAAGELDCADRIEVCSEEVGVMFEAADAWRALDVMGAP